MSKEEYENHLDAVEPRWFAVYTRYKCEKMVFRQLVRKTITVYLPLQKHTRRYTRKIRTVELPLISCYIFVQITKEDYVKVLETENVQGFVRFAKNLISIPDQEIDLMRRILGESWEVQAEKTTFVPGDEVEIAVGNLLGMKGTLVEVEENKPQVLVDLDRLGYTLRISVDKSILQKTGRVNQKSSH
ncbi:MAG: UpxY family transcription antiterminator [Saprospirales bacterium]|nr:UpxY family transcription antiterminator [Saprospirales bacterium]MBK8490009.1 UpxY family transcription antiterminator [Saprospirales bacterium]